MAGVHVEVQGSGPLVVLLHSGGMSGRQWSKLSALLSPAWRVAAVDFLGSGQSPDWPDGQPFEFHRDVAEVLRVIDELATPTLDGPGCQAHLVGHSYGGLVALTLARLHPSRVRSLALYDPVAFGVIHPSPGEAGDAEALQDLERTPLIDDQAGGGEAWFEAFVGYWNGPGAWAALPERSRAAFLRVGRKVYLEVRSLMGDRTPASAYQELDLPTLLLQCERTPLAARRVVERLGLALPAARVTTVAGAGHMGPLTHAATVNALIAEHLAAVSGPAPPPPPAAT